MIDPEEAMKMSPEEIVNRRSDLLMEIARVRDIYVRVFENDVKDLKNDMEILSMYWKAKTQRGVS